MINWKAVLGGSVTTILIVIVIDLVYVLFASLIASYSNANPWFSAYKEQIWFFSAMTVYCFSMGLGGAVSIYFDDDRNIRNAFIVGILASLVSVWSMAPANTEFNSMSLVFLLLGIGAATIGGALAVILGDSALPEFSTERD